MRIACGMIVARRPEMTAEHCRKRIQMSHMPVITFGEPGCEELCATYKRPEHLAPIGKGIHPSPSGQFGNFQNWIQAARDMTFQEDYCDAVMMVEDDAHFAGDVTPILLRDLWPSADCGVVSLYCPNMTNYPQKVRGLNQTQVARPEKMQRSGNLVGALALVFPFGVLKELAWHQSVGEWHGSHSQYEDKSTKPWERKAVDTWIGRTLVSMGHTIWHYSPSMVLHYEPHRGRSNSSMGHSVASRTRQARAYVGDRHGDLSKLYLPRKEKYEIPASDLQGASRPSGQ
jgi:hypothetical protein